jgi:hypothetical protein
MATIDSLKVGFGEALDALRQDRRVRRAAWAPTHFLRLAWPTHNSLPVIQLWGRTRVEPWRPEHVDLLATDWTLLSDALVSS